MSESDPRALYLDLMKRCLLGLIIEDPPIASFKSFDGEGADFSPQAFDWTLRENGVDWPSQAHSMIGLLRMNNVQCCVEKVIAANVPGDLMETGVWRGGATIFMRAILKAHGANDRIVWVADSFQGLPVPNAQRYPEDAGLDFTRFNHVLGVSLEEVKRNFERYGLLDEQVRFLKGWFRDTLPKAPIDRLAVLRLDGDLYESTIDSLTHLYPKLSIGGYLIVDDYHIPACAQAVEDYRKRNGIREDVVRIDGCGVYWKREG